MSPTPAPAQSTRNPFPEQGAFSIEGRRRGPHGEPLIDMTLILPVETQLRRLAAVYLERFGATDAPRGQAIAVRGEHGLGKTHALGFLMHQIDSGRLKPGPQVREVLQLYVKAGDSQLAEIYRRLMRQIPVEQLRDLAVRFTAGVAQEALEESKGEAVGSYAADRLSSDPVLVYDLFDTSFVDEGSVRERRAHEVHEVTGGAREFQRALRYLESDLEDVAYRWLTGLELDAEEASEIGVKGSITSPDNARAGLQILAALCSRSRTALIIYLDQYEKLVLDSLGKPVRENIAVLQTLAEVLPREDAMLVIAGNEEAWSALPRDLRQRFGYNQLDARGLDLAEAKALIALYLHPADEVHVRRDVGADELEPCTVDSVTKAHLLSGGNARRLLQLFSEAFKLVGPGATIDAGVIEAAARAGGIQSPEPEEVLAEITRLAERRGYAVEPGPRSSLRLALEGSVRLLVMIGQAEHYYDEILNARDRFEEIEELHRSEPGAFRAVLVVLGYDSPEVREALERAGVEVAPYGAPDFGDSLSAILKDVRQEATGDDDPGELASRLSEVSRRLDELLAQRQADAEGLEAKSRTLLRSVDEEEVASRWNKAAGDWTVERRAQEGAIREARARRASDDLADLERLRQHAESERHDVVRAISLVAAVFAVITAVAFTLGGNVIVAGIWLVCAAVLVGGLFIWGMFQSRRYGAWGLRKHVLRPRALRELSAPVGSLDELGPLAHRTRAVGAPVPFLLSHENPQVRYVAAIAARPEDLYLLAMALPGERSVVVRRAFAQRLGRDPEEARAAYSDAVEADTREAIYVLEGMLRRGERPSDELAKAPHRILVEMSTRPELTPATRALMIEPGWVAAVEEAGGPAALEVALRSDLHLAHRDALRRIPIEVVRDAARAVSPFEAGALGTFDHLVEAPAIETAYLQLSQVLFLSELGLLVDPAA